MTAPVTPKKANSKYNGYQPKEKVIQAHILAYLKLNGYFVWRENSGVMLVRNHQYRFGMKGVADIIGITPKGKFLAVEVKKNGSYQNPNQKEFERQVRECHGIYILARSVNEVQETLRLVENGE